MNFVRGIVNGLQEVWGHKVRSLLTMTGIILGVAALVAMIGMVEGTMSGWKSWIYESGGIEKLMIQAKEPPEDQQYRAFLSPGRTLRDATAIKNACPLAVYVAPEIYLKSQMQHRDNVERVRTMGVTREFLHLNRHEIERGRFIGDLDQERFNRVVVIGSHVRKELFGKNAVALGKEVNINGVTFTVVGELKHYHFGGERSDRNGLEWKNKFAFIPLRTAQKFFTGNDAITSLNVQIADVRLIDDAVEQIYNTILQAHRGIEDFQVETREEMLQEFKEVETGFKAGVGGVAAITLLVGGIGIMNVMLASISERIREIGVRKALGARSTDIFVQFLAEAVSLSLVGGVLGLAASVGLISILQNVLPDMSRPILLASAMALGFAFSVLVGITAGIYPAFRAATLDPIEALRYE